MSVGFVYAAGCVLIAVAPIRRPWAIGLACWLASLFPLELPLHFLAVVVVSNGPELRHGDPIPLAAGGVVLAGLVVVIIKAHRAKDVLDRALADALGAGWRWRSGSAINARTHLPWLRMLATPWPLRPRRIERIRNLSYGPNGRDNRFDLYRLRGLTSTTPVLVYLHPGGFRWGNKSREARALLFHMARCGWSVVSANYHRSPRPATGFPQHLIDVKRLIAWLRDHGAEHGIDAAVGLALVGGSAGAHLTMMAALTANQPAYQPGFEDADTSITAGVGLYGYYGRLGGPSTVATSPLAHDASHAPPLLIIHGDRDTFTPVHGARDLARHLRRSSAQPVALAVLPGAQHSFDMFSSIRFEHVVDAIHGFVHCAIAAAATAANPRLATWPDGDGHRATPAPSP